MEPLSPYDLEYDDHAIEDARQLSQEVRSRVKKKVEWLAGNFDNLNPESLRDSRFRAMLKLRVGDYRVLYSVNRRNRVIAVHLIKHRRDVYE